MPAPGWALVTILLLTAAPAHGQRSLPPSCHGFLSPVCCCTAGCCAPVAPGAIEHLGGDRYLVHATGEVVARTDWSQDGRTWRCHCAQRDGRWVREEGAKTSCLYPAPSLF